MKKTGLRFLKYALAGVLLLPSLVNLAFAEETDPISSPPSAGESASVLRIEQIKDAKDFSLTFTLPTGIEERDMKDFRGETESGKYKLLISLYKVAGIKADDRYDTYSYDGVKATDLKDAEGNSVDLTTYDGLKNLDKDDWIKIAEQTAEQIGKLTKVSPDAVYTSSGAVANGLEAGLYLVVAHDAEHTELVDGLGVANTSIYEYQFLPQLVSIPTPKDKDISSTGWTVTDDSDFQQYYAGVDISTDLAGNVGWSKTMTVMLKPQREYRLSSLVIRKRLDSYQAGRAATFVFRVSGKLDDKTYENVAAITFTNEGGLKQVVLDNIPVNMEITVEELTGAATSFIAVGDTVKTTVINPPNQVAASVEFENDRGNEEPHGHGVDNKFIYNEKSKNWEKDDKLDHSTRYEDIIPIPADNDQTGTDAGEEGTEGNN